MDEREQNWRALAEAILSPEEISAARALKKAREAETAAEPGEDEGHMLK